MNKQILEVFTQGELPEEDYRDLENHIQEHKYFLNEDIPFEVTWDQAVFSWYDNIYRHIRNYFVGSWIVQFVFPSVGLYEFYFFVMDHWHYMKKNSEKTVFLEEAVVDFVKTQGQRKFWGRVLAPFVRYR